MNKTTAVCIGDFEFSPTKFVSAEFEHAHPRDFQRIAEAMLGGRFWTNNPYIIDHFDPGNIICCSPHGRAVLSRHPEWPKWRNCMSPGEFWSCIAYDWPDQSYFDQPSQAPDQTGPGTTSQARSAGEAGEA